MDLIHSEFRVGHEDSGLIDTEITQSNDTHTYKTHNPLIFVVYFYFTAPGAAFTPASQT